MKKILLFAAAFAAVSASAADLYVSLATGKNKNAGTKEAPLKNLWKALENAADGDTIHLAEGALKLFGAMSGKGAQEIKAKVE